MHERFPGAVIVRRGPNFVILPPPGMSPEEYTAIMQELQSYFAAHVAVLEQIIPQADGTNKYIFKFYSQNDPALASIPADRIVTNEAAGGILSFAPGDVPSKEQILFALEEEVYRVGTGDASRVGQEFVASTAYLDDWSPEARLANPELVRDPLPSERIGTFYSDYASFQAAVAGEGGILDVARASGETYTIVRIDINALHQYFGFGVDGVVMVDLVKARLRVVAQTTEGIEAGCYEGSGSDELTLMIRGGVDEAAVTMERFWTSANREFIYYPINTPNSGVDLATVPRGEMGFTGITGTGAMVEIYYDDPTQHSQFALARARGEVISQAEEAKKANPQRANLMVEGFEVYGAEGHQVRISSGTFSGAQGTPEFAALLEVLQTKGIEQLIIADGAAFDTIDLALLLDTLPAGRRAIIVTSTGIYEVPLAEGQILQVQSTPDGSVYKLTGPAADPFTRVILAEYRSDGAGYLQISSSTVSAPVRVSELPAPNLRAYEITYQGQTLLVSRGSPVEVDGLRFFVDEYNGMLRAEYTQGGYQGIRVFSEGNEVPSGGGLYFGGGEYEIRIGSNSSELGVTIPVSSFGYSLQGFEGLPGSWDTSAEGALFEVGRSIQAHGTGHNPLALQNLVSIALDGEIRPPQFGDINFGFLNGGGGLAADSAGEHGPFYVVLQGNPTAGESIPSQYHYAYVVPDQTAKDLFINCINEAERLGLITHARADQIRGMVRTYQEFIAEVHSNPDHPALFRSSVPDLPSPVDSTTAPPPAEEVGRPSAAAETARPFIRTFMSQPIPLENGDSIMIYMGGETVRLFRENSQIYLQRGSETPVAFYNGATLGRSEDSTLVLSSPRVSRDHLTIIENAQGEIILLDHSTNGTEYMRIPGEAAPSTTAPSQRTGGAPLDVQAIFDSNNLEVDRTIFSHNNSILDALLHSGINPGDEAILYANSEGRLSLTPEEGYYQVKISLTRAPGGFLYIQGIEVDARLSASSPQAIVNLYSFFDNYNYCSLQGGFIEFKHSYSEALMLINGDRAVSDVSGRDLVVELATTVERFRRDNPMQMYAQPVEPEYTTADPPTTYEVTLGDDVAATPAPEGAVTAETPAPVWDETAGMPPPVETPNPPAELLAQMDRVSGLNAAQKLGFAQALAERGVDNFIINPGTELSVQDMGLILAELTQDPGEHRTVVVIRPDVPGTPPIIYAIPTGDIANLEGLKARTNSAIGFELYLPATDTRPETLVARYEFGWETNGIKIEQVEVNPNYANEADALLSRINARFDHLTTLMLTQAYRDYLSIRAEYGTLILPPGLSLATWGTNSALGLLSIFAAEEIWGGIENPYARLGLNLFTMHSLSAFSTSAANAFFQTVQNPFTTFGANFGQNIRASFGPQGWNMLGFGLITGFPINLAYDSALAAFGVSPDNFFRNSTVELIFTMVATAGVERTLIAAIGQEAFGLLVRRLNIVTALLLLAGATAYGFYLSTLPEIPVEFQDPQARLAEIDQQYTDPIERAQAKYAYMVSLAEWVEATERHAQDSGCADSSDPLDGGIANCNGIPQEDPEFSIANIINEQNFNTYEAARQNVENTFKAWLAERVQQDLQSGIIDPSLLCDPEALVAHYYPLFLDYVDDELLGLGELGDNQAEKEALAYILQNAPRTPEGGIDYAAMRVWITNHYQLIPHYAEIFVRADGAVDMDKVDNFIQRLKVRVLQNQLKILATYYPTNPETGVEVNDGSYTLAFTEEGELLSFSHFRTLVLNIWQPVLDQLHSAGMIMELWQAQQFTLEHHPSDQGLWVDNPSPLPNNMGQVNLNAPEVQAALAVMRTQQRLQIEARMAQLILLALTNANNTGSTTLTTGYTQLDVELGLVNPDGSINTSSEFFAGARALILQENAIDFRATYLTEHAVNGEAGLGTSTGINELDLALDIYVHPNQVHSGIVPLDLATSQNAANLQNAALIQQMLAQAATGQLMGLPSIPDSAQMGDLFVWNDSGCVWELNLNSSSLGPALELARGIWAAEGSALRELSLTGWKNRVLTLRLAYAQAYQDGDQARMYILGEYLAALGDNMLWTHDIRYIDRLVGLSNQWFALSAEEPAEAFSQVMEILQDASQGDMPYEQSVALMTQILAAHRHQDVAFMIAYQGTDYYIRYAQGHLAVFDQYGSSVGLNSAGQPISTTDPEEQKNLVYTLLVSVFGDDSPSIPSSLYEYLQNIPETINSGQTFNLNLLTTAFYVNYNGADYYIRYCTDGQLWVFDSEGNPVTMNANGIPISSNNLADYQNAVQVILVYIFGSDDPDHAEFWSYIAALPNTTFEGQPVIELTPIEPGSF